MRRLPWVTIAIAAICILVQAFAAATWVDVADAEQRYAAVSRQVLLEYGDELPGASAQARLAAFERQEIVDDSEPLYREYMTAKRGRDRAVAVYPMVAAGFRPADGQVLRLFSYAFVHGGWFHLLSNLLFLYLAGCNLEDRWTKPWFAAFYLLGALVAGLTFWAVHPSSDVYLVGASGAIAALLGAFFVIYWSAQINFFYLVWAFFRFYTGTFHVRAYVALPIWFLLQAINVTFEVGGIGGVAYSAHVGGFVFGALVGLVLRQSGIDAKLEAQGDDVVYERNPQVATWAGRMHADPAGALQAFRGALLAQPLDVEARQHVERVLRGAPMSKPVAAQINGYVHDEAKRGASANLVAVYGLLSGRNDDAEDWLGDGALLAIAQAAAQMGNDRLAITVFGQLINQYPNSHAAPRAMWDAAMIQEAGRRYDLARKTLLGLVERYPADPFAAQATRRLEQLSQPSSPQW